MKRVCLGYDIRIARGVFLSKSLCANDGTTTNDKFLSADPNVWPRQEELFEKIANHCNPLSLITNLEFLSDIYEKFNMPINEWTQIALTCNEPIIPTLIERYGPGWFENSLGERHLIRRGWELIGFDILDLNGLITGLMHLGYQKSSASSSIQHYWTKLNQVGLFPRYELASEFAEIRGLQIPSHAPYVPVGILLKAIEK